MNDEPYQDRRDHSPLARLEKTTAITKEEIKEIQIWKAAHEESTKNNEKNLSELMDTTYGNDKNGVKGVKQKVENIENTISNLWKYIASTGIIVGILSNLDKFIK